MRSACACCQRQLSVQLLSAREVTLRNRTETAIISHTIHMAKPNQGNCRLCGQPCCAHCLTLDEVCDTCLPTLDKLESF